MAAGLRAGGGRIARSPETNIVLLEVLDAAAFVDAARQTGVLVNALGPHRVRALTHLDGTPQHLSLMRT